MNRKTLFILPTLLLTSCNNKSYPIQDYILSIPYKNDFKILQLTDTHIAAKDDRERQYKYLDHIITTSNPDMIIVTGDLFTFVDKTTAIEYFNFLDSYGVYWTVTFGNHDEQCYFSIEWLTSTLNNFGSNCIFKDIQDDNIAGNANFAINLIDGSDAISQLIVMDSLRYNFGEYRGYDYMKSNQVDWYEDLIDYTSDTYNKIIPSLMFFHIPLPEFKVAWELYEQGSSEVTLILGSNDESISSPKKDSGLFDKIVDLGSSKAIFVGHDHTNNSALIYKGITLSYGLTSTDRIYCDEAKMGGQEIIVHNDGTFSLNQIFATYEDISL